jgi:MFS superfamily sulfate permease-like transporter
MNDLVVSILGILGVLVSLAILIFWIWVFIRIPSEAFIRGAGFFRCVFMCLFLGPLVTWIIYRVFVHYPIEENLLE